MRRLRQQFVQDAELLAVKLAGERHHPGNIAARPIEACDKSQFHRVRPKTEHDRNCSGRILGRPCGKPAGDHNDYAHLAAHQIRCQFGQAGRVIVREAILDREVLTLDIAGILQTLTISRKVVGGCCSEHQQADDRSFRLLRTRCQRPRGGATENTDKCAPLHAWVYFEVSC
jgi:hypothetical protein